MSEKHTPKKKGFRMPHMYLVIAILMLFVSILTYIVPAGTYVRDASGAVDPGSFSYISRTPVGLLRFFTSIHQGFVESGNIIGTVLICTGCIEILSATGTFSAGIQSLIRKAKGKNIVIVVLFFTIFTAMGVIGYLDGLYPFYAILISIFMMLGYDRMVGTAIIMLSTAVGFTSGLVNPYTTGISQTLVGLPMYSGIGFRAVGLVVFYLIALAFLVRYCRMIEKDPSKSVMGANYRAEQVAPLKMEEGLEFNGKRIAVLVAFLLCIIGSVIGALKLSWGMAEIAALYFPVVILAVVLFKMNPNEACSHFVVGMQSVVGTTIVIGLSRAVSILLTSGNIIDTFIKVMSDTLGGASKAVTLLVIYLFVTFFNFFVASGSGKAMMMMPIMRPLGEILGINQQVMVLTYQYGDGLTNTLWPGSAVTQLSLCGMDYGKWFKFAWKVYAALLAAAFILIVIADKISYGPF
ncbi:MAG: YfcC family protein [Oscillibacter sp.]|nr:YfcC family protein [Oscillibacter sp.]